jgi:hypothetical protein
LETGVAPAKLVTACGPPSTAVVAVGTSRNARVSWSGRSPTPTIAPWSSISYAAVRSRLPPGGTSVFRSTIWSLLQRNATCTSSARVDAPTTWSWLLRPFAEL